MTQTRLLLVLLLMTCATTLVAADTTSPGFVDVPGGELYYESTGEGPALVVLHGFGARWRPEQWQALTDSIGASNRIVGFDIRGFGRSLRSHDSSVYGVETAHDVVRVLDALGIERAVFLGYSMGGIVALKAAELHPDRVSAVVLLGQGWLDREELVEMAEGGRQLALTDTTQLPEEQRRGFRVNDVQAVSAMTSTYPDLYVTDEALRSLPVPLLAILGSDDPRIERAHRLQAVRPDAEIVVLEGRSHGTVVDDGAYAGAVRRFLAGLDAEGP
jgi:pimeloyl-ACP methyl ester carboxylesterase